MGWHLIIVVAGLSACGPAAIPSVPVVNVDPPNESKVPTEKTTPRVPTAPPAQRATGTLTGIVRFSGQLPSPRRLPAKCQGFPDAARALRVGPGGVIGDVIVGVTNWEGTSPKAPDSFQLDLTECAASPRTVVLGPSERLRITNRDPWPYTFSVRGDGSTSHTLASGATSDILEKAIPGRYQLTSNDSVIDVPIFVVRFATQAVTDTHGRYLIERVPVGPAKLSALVPATNAGVDLEIDVHEGENNHDVELG